MAPNTRKLNLDDVGSDEGSAGVSAGNDPFDQIVAFEDIKGDVLIPLGEYALRNVKIDLKMSKSSKQPMFTIKTVVTDGEVEGTTKYFDFSWSPGAQPRSKTAFVGMGLPEDFRGSLRQIAEALEDLEYFALIDVEQSDGINERTQRPYDPRNKVVSTSQSPLTA